MASSHTWRNRRIVWYPHLHTLTTEALRILHDEDIPPYPCGPAYFYCKLAGALLGRKRLAFTNRVPFHMHSTIPNRRSINLAP
jgi:hypothetical protein